MKKNIREMRKKVARFPKMNRHHNDNQYQLRKKALAPAVEVRVIENRAKALELRRDGYSFKAIGKALGISTHTAYKYVTTELLELRENTQLDAELVRSLELERLDKLYQSLESGIKAGDPSSIATALRVMERRAKMLGYDAPSKGILMGAFNEVTPEEAAKMGDDEIKERIKNLLMRAAGTSLPASEE